MKFQITSDPKEVSDFISLELSKQIDARIKSKTSAIRAEISNLISDELRKTPHVISLLSGKLQSDFGLSTEAAELAVKQIIDTIKSSTVISVKRDVSEKFVYSIFITLLPNGISSLLNIGYESKGGSVDWLEWLLTKGVTVVVDNYRVLEGDFTQSRSGKSIMVPATSLSIIQTGRFSYGTVKRTYDAFRVDPEFAGTESDNFIVNTLRSVLPQIAEIIRKQI